MKHLISYNVVYRVPTVDDVLELREELSDLPNGKLESFSYAEKYIKEKGQIVEEYQLVKAKIVVNRTFGTANMLELYSEYVAKKICEEMKNN